MPKYSDLTFTVRPEHKAYARPGDRYACIGVRAIQQAMPEATRVTVDKNTTRLTIKGDGEHGMTYEWDTDQNFIQQIARPFDRHESVDIPDGGLIFNFGPAKSCTPVHVRTEEEKAAARARQSPNLRSPSHRGRRHRTRTGSNLVRSYGRWTETEVLDAEASGTEVS